MFPQICGSSEGFRNVTCVKNVVGVSNGILNVKDTFPSTNPVFMSAEFHENHKTVTILGCIWPPSVLGILSDLSQCCLSLPVEI